MKNKSFAVIGLGQFGMTLAVTLAESDCDVLAIDDKEENIEEISEKVTYAVKADVREPGILKALGVQNVDVAIIAVAENLEASISATILFMDVYSTKLVQIRSFIRNSPWDCGLPEILCPAGIWMCLSFRRSSVWRSFPCRYPGLEKIW